MEHEGRVAMFWKRAEEDKVSCGLCRHHCLITDGKRGICGVRENRGGTLFTLVYDKIIARNLDPVEKKPLFHFHPGTLTYSIATPGCNFRCLHCQNSDISRMPADQGRIEGIAMAPGEIVEAAISLGASSISYTYTEPTIFFEIAYDTAREAHARGLKNIFVTNGYITDEPLKEIAPILSAANIDLKGMSEDFYLKVCGAKLSGVLEAIRAYHAAGIWIEITTLLIPGLNDSEEELKKLAGFIASLDTSIPWHVTRFHPSYRILDRPATPIATIERAIDIGKAVGLDHVYAGNIPTGEGENTICPGCGKTVIGRRSFSVTAYDLKDGACGGCGRRIAGFFTGS